MGDIGVSKLYGQYTDYQSFGLDVGLRRYLRSMTGSARYGRRTIGMAFVDETRRDPRGAGSQPAGNATDFYDKTAAFTLGGIGVSSGDAEVDVFTQVGLRWVTGMSDMERLEGTGLETINDKSSRWTMPFIGRGERPVLMSWHLGFAGPSRPALEVQP